MKKHMVYAEDIISKLMKYPDNAIYKYELNRLINEVVAEKEVTLGMCMPTAGWSDIDDDGDIYD